MKGGLGGGGRGESRGLEARWGLDGGGGGWPNVRPPAMIPASCQRSAPVYIFKNEERSVSSEMGGRGELGERLTGR